MSTSVGASELRYSRQSALQSIRAVFSLLEISVPAAETALMSNSAHGPKLPLKRLAAELASSASGAALLGIHTINPESTARTTKA
jgi:hypothetical protein